MVCPSQAESESTEYLSELCHGDGDFAMLKAYFDESGIHDKAKICVVAGFVLEASRADLLGSIWKYDVLAPFKLPYFHAKEFANRSGPFRGWSDTMAQTFTNRAMVGIRRAMLDYEWPPMLIGSAIRRCDFLALSEEDRRWLTGGTFVTSSLDERPRKWKRQGAPTKPYFLAFQQAVLDAAKYERHMPWGTSYGRDFKGPRKGNLVHYVLDRQDDYEATAKAVFNAMQQMPLSVKDRLGDVVFSSKLKVLPLQVADFIAYEAYSLLQNREDGQWQKSTPLLEGVWGGNTRYVFVDEKELNKLVVSCPLQPNKRFILPDP